MLIQEPGKVTNKIDYLGTRELCLYLLKGKEAMLIEGGMSWIVPTLERQLAAMEFNLEKVKYLVITHSHFDHCGAVPYLKRRFPHIQILASAQSQKIFSKEKATHFIADINKQMIEGLGLQDEYETLNLKFDGIKVDRVMSENDIIDLGNGINVHFMEVPGHTQCCIAVYVPALKAIFPSDSAPYPTDDGSNLLYPSGQYDFSLYTQSLRKIANREVEICAFGHNGVAIGEKAKKVLHQGLQQTEEFKNYIIEQYRQTGDLDTLAHQVATAAMRKNKNNLMSIELQTNIAKTVIGKILRSAEE